MKGQRVSAEDTERLLAMVARGLGQREIATELGIGVSAARMRILRQASRRGLGSMRELASAEAVRRALASVESDLRQCAISPATVALIVKRALAAAEVQP